MRLFIGQTNRVFTDAVINGITDAPITDATVTINLYDDGETLVPSSNVTLDHEAAGVYSKVWPEFAGLSHQEQCQIEVTVTVSGVNVWYYKGPITAIIRGMPLSQ